MKIIFLIALYVINIASKSALVSLRGRGESCWLLLLLLVVGCWLLVVVVVVIVVAVAVVVIIVVAVREV